MLHSLSQLKFIPNSNVGCLLRFEFGIVTFLIAARWHFGSSSAIGRCVFDRLALYSNLEKAIILLSFVAVERLLCANVIVPKTGYCYKYEESFA